MNFPINELTQCSSETEDIGRRLAESITGDDGLPRFVAMYGDLGVGKTAFVRGFCSEICRGVTLKSPNSALVNE